MSCFVVHIKKASVEKETHEHLAHTHAHTCTHTHVRTHTQTRAHTQFSLYRFSLRSFCELLQEIQWNKYQSLDSKLWWLVGGGDSLVP